MELSKKTLIKKRNKFHVQTMSFQFIEMFRYVIGFCLFSAVFGKILTGP